MTAAERGRIRALAADLPALWASPTTCGADRRAVVRLLVERVELTRRGGSELVDVVVHWRGGAVGRHVVRQRIRRYRDLNRHAALLARLRELRAEGRPSGPTADALNGEGFVLPRGDRFTRQTVRRLLREFGLTGRTFGPLPGPDEWWLRDLASTLGVTPHVLYRWQESGYIRARQRAGGQTDWIVWANAAEVRRRRRLREFEQSHRCRKPPAELSTPGSLRTTPGTRGAGSSSARKGG